jgi:TRAP transporter TAXI family solute receptor
MAPRFHHLSTAALALCLTLGTTAARSAEPLPKLLALGTNPAGSAYYSVGSALAKILSENSGMQVRVQPYSGSTTYMPLINSGELELGLNHTNDVRLAYRGEKPFHRSPNLRMLSVIFPLVVGAIVRNDSDIQRIEDIRGKRVTGRYTAQLAVYYNWTAILAGAGMDWNDVVVVPVPGVNEGIQAFIEGRADVTLTALVAAKLEEANATIPGGVRFIPINTSPEGVKRMQSIVGGSFPYPVKAGKLTGVVKDVSIMGYDAYMTAGKSLRDDVAYQVTKTLWEQEAAIRKSQRLLAGFARNEMVKTIATIPYHPGAIRFYREKGMWSPEMEKVQAELEKEGEQGG